MQEEEFGLSSNALEALKQFANDQGLDLQNENNIMQSVQDALNKDSKYETLSYDYKDNLNNLNIQLKSISQEYGQTLQSTGLTVWRAAEDLGNFVFSNRQKFKGKKIIELGAGLGLIGVLLGCINKEGFVNITDGDEENGHTLDLLEENIKENSHLVREKNIAVQRLWWGDQKEIDIALQKANNFQLKYEGEDEEQFVDEQGYDYIFGADVVYCQEAVKPLIETVDKLLKRKSKNAKFYLAFARRNIPIDEVFAEADKYNLTYKQTSFKCSVDKEYIYVFQRK